MKFSRASLLASLAFASGLASQQCIAAVTPYSWIRGGEGGIFADSSGNNHPFNAAFSSRAGGDPAALIVADSVGGPLGNTSAISTLSTRWGYYSLANSGMWVQGPNNTPPPTNLWSLPASNWVVEVWVKPVGTGGSAGHTDAQFVSTGSPHFGGKPGGVAFRTHYNSDDDTVIGRVDSIGSSASDNFTIGDTTVLSKDHWTHLAAVNDNGVTTFYVNGVANGPSTNNVTAPSGVPYIGSGEDTGAPFDGYLDEIRYSTFAPGAFAVSDLLLLPPGASIIAQPKSATVWSGGPAIFQIKTPVDSRTTFQWKLNGQPITAATSANLYLPAVTLADSGKVYSVVLSNSGVDVTSSNATLTVVAPETANNDFYRQAVQSESSLLAYFPVDNDSGAILTNVKDASHNGTIQGNASFDGRTDRAYGIRSLRLNGDGDVSVPANPNYEFTDGSGTIEAIVYLDKSPVDPSPENIFSIATGEGSSAQVYYQFQVSADGTTLLYSNDTLTSPVSWNSPVSLLNRFTHVALVFDNHGDADPANDTVTAFVDGLSLGAKPNPNFGAQTGLSANIGSASVGSSGLPVGAWNGNIDELAIYGDALSSATIAIHNSRFIYGTNVSKPTIVSAPTGSSTYLAGGAPSFRVNASGTAPLTYEWKLNGAPIANNPTASTASFTILNSTVNSSGTYTVTVSNPIGEVTSDPFTVTFNPVPAGDKYASFILGDHPSAFWRLDETTGTNLVDYAGGHNGTYHGDVQLGKEGAPGTAPDTAAHFPGSLTGGIPNAVVPYSSALNPTGPFSLEFWAKPDVGGQVSQAVVASQDRNAGRAGYVVYQGFNGAAWEGHLGVGDGAKIVIGQTVPVAGRWDHIVFVWDGNSIGRIWVNGVDDTRSDSDTGGPLRPNLNVPLEIGSRFNGQFPYQGTVDEVAFYN
ncbi:MAG: Immunoglobulin I-set domain protein [Verrucomicrobiales bacterium]|nr:Immunoglobulin I-set domain protein [Verrucomicrobiales bacterium]